MAPFRWPTVANNLQLDTEVAARRPNSPSDWEVIAVVLSQAFSTDDDNQVELTGRACRERMDRLFTKYNEEDKKSLKKRNSVMESEDDSSSSSGEGSDTTIASACPSSSKGKKGERNIGGPRKKIQHRATKQSAMEMLANKYNQKAELKEKELELRKMELEFQQKKYEAEAEERKAKIHLELEERKAMLALLKDRL
ncbi:hypothetical protein ACROYT_G001707 [Oculina patagonica]